MYAISKNKRKYSPTPIVRLTVGADGKQQEEIVLIPVGKKTEADAMSERIVKLLNGENYCTCENPNKKYSQIDKGILGTFTYCRCDICYKPTK